MVKFDKLRIIHISIHTLFSYILKILDRIFMYAFKGAFCTAGKNVIFHPLNSSFSYKTISLGNRISIGEHAAFNTTLSHIYISDNVMFGPNVSIRGGNHSSHIVGKLLIDYKESDKRKNDDEPVYIEEDVWVGANATILKGVTVGRGSIVAAGAVVNRSTPPYSIVGGVPAKVLKFRWNGDIDIIMEHEKLIYKTEHRLSRLLLENNICKTIN